MCRRLTKVLLPRDKRSWDRTVAGYCCALILVGLSSSPGCTTKQYVQQADKVTYRTITKAQVTALGAERPFSVEYRPITAEGETSGGIIRIGEKKITIGKGTDTALTLDDALEIAFRNSRNFQDEKETLYSLGLELASTRRSWDFPQFGGEGTADVETSREMKGDSAHAGSAAVGPTLTQRFIHGGMLTLGTTIEIASDLLGWGGTAVGSLLEANFTQPLLRGAWRGLAYEDQYRLERDFLFEVYEYERFTQMFAAAITESYYAVLRRQDQLENEKVNIERLEERLKVTKTLVEGGQTRRIELDQMEQDVLEAQVRFEELKQTYENQLDEFKLTLGIPIKADVVLNYSGELQGLQKRGLKPIPFQELEAITVALQTRPDVLREFASLRDVERDVEIAADDFLPQLDLALGISAPSTHQRKFWSTRFDRHRRFASLSLQYDLDQTDNRDAYRNAILNLEKGKRDLDEFVDNVVLDVRQSYRDLLRSGESYKLQVRSVEVARRLSLLAAEEHREGMGSARDVLEAERDLRNAKNGRTRALVDYTMARLTFLGRLGMLRVDERGRIHEREEPFKFGSISHRYEYLKTR